MSLKLMRIFWKWNPKVIHFHDTIIYPVLPFLSSLGLLKKTYITFHGWEGVCPPMPRVVNRRRKIASAIKGSIAIGAFIEKWYGTKSNYISYGGVDVERYGMIKQSGCDPNELRIGYFGRFEPDTGLLEVVEAVQNCNRQLNQKVRLDLYGAGSLRDRLCALNEEEAVVTPLPIAKDPSAVLAKYSIVIASGYLTILEALCAERIVFAQYNNELREDYLRMHPAASSIFICKETGDFVAGILRCLSDPAGVAAKSKVGWDWAKRQSWEKVAATYTELWRL
jgi:glycosyltransferase involved in cell wall biosynthesis